MPRVTKVRNRLSVSHGRSVKVTVSLPAELFAWGERERGRQPRSEFVSTLYREQQLRKRVAHAAAAYRVQPSSAAEDALLQVGREDLHRSWSAE